MEHTLAANLISLTKPRITLFVVATGFAGIVLAPSSISTGGMLSVLLATALAVASANTLNCYLERSSDGLMERTRDRPLPSGRMAPVTALGFGIGFAVTSLAWLCANRQWIAAGIAALSIVSYVWVYTPLKRRSPLALYVGAVPGALPPLIGFSAVEHRIGAAAVALFALLLLWQVPHFLAIAIFRRAEYERAGLRTLAVVHGEETARWHTLVTLIAVLPVSLSLYWLDAAGPIYAVGATLAGASWIVDALRWWSRLPVTRWARRVFFGSLYYVPAITVALILDRAL